MKRLETNRRINRYRDQFFGVFFCNLFDVHSAFCGGHHDDATSFAVEKTSNVVLFLNVATLLDVNLLNLFPFGTGLMGHERHAQHLLRVVADFV